MGFLVSQLVKDLDLKAFHNAAPQPVLPDGVSQLVKDLDLKAFHNVDAQLAVCVCGITARQRS